MKTRRSTNHSPRRNFVFRPLGFTLIEIIMVLAIMGMLAAMVVPFLSRLDQTDRGQMTQDNLEQIRKAILGPRDNFDENGYRVAGGFVGDMGYLPKLYNCNYDADAQKWLWDTTDENHQDGHKRPMNQPCGLWMEQWADTVDESSADVQDLRKEGPWNGPYLNKPEDPYPNDSGQYEWDNENENAEENDEVRMRVTNDRLSDAWGRSLLFWKEGEGINTTLWVISEGPDHASVWGYKKDGSWGYHNDPAEAATTEEGNDAIKFNADNIIMKITPNEWYQHNVQVKADETARTLEKIRAAIIGPRNAYDEYGQPVIGGYVADMDTLPTLYRTEWDVNGKRWLWDAQAYETSLSDTHPWGQPRGLWKKQWTDEVGTIGSPVILSSNWSGAYVAFPRDKSPLDTMHHSWSNASDRDEISMRETNEKLSDAWGRSLIFWADERETSTTLWIISEGSDRQSKWESSAGVSLWPGDISAEWENLPENRDNIVLTISPNEWHRTISTSSSSASSSASSEGPMTSLFAVDLSIGMYNTASVDSYDSSIGAYDAASNSGSLAVVSTNSTDSYRVSLQQSSTIKGSVLVGPGADPANSIAADAGSISGTMGNLTETIPILPIATPENMPANEGAFTVPSGTPVTVSGDRRFESMVVDGTLSIDGNVRILVDSDFLAILSSSNIVLTPGSSLALYVFGNFNLQNSAAVNAGGRPRDVHLYILGDAKQILIENLSSITGVINNPGGFLRVENSANVYGAFKGKYFDAKNSGGVHLDTSLLE